MRASRRLLRHPANVYIPFDAARTQARRVGVVSRSQWLAWWSTQRPPQIPKLPNVAYRSQGWQDWVDWLGQPPPVRDFERTDGNHRTGHSQIPAAAGEIAVHIVPALCQPTPNTNTCKAGVAMPFLCFRRPRPAEYPRSPRPRTRRRPPSCARGSVRSRAACPGNARGDEIAAEACGCVLPQLFAEDSAAHGPAVLFQV